MMSRLPAQVFSLFPFFPRSLKQTGGPAMWAAVLSLTLAATSAQAEDATVPAPQDEQFINGIAAIVEGKVITFDDVRREVGPLIPRLQATARNEQEYLQQLEALQESAIQSLVDRVLIVKEFYKVKDGEQQRQIPPKYVDDEISQRLIEEFEGDRSLFHAYLRSRGMTQREFRAEVEEFIIYQYMVSQKRRTASIISPVRVEQYYRENKEQFAREDEAHTRMIQFTRMPGQTDAELLAKANTALARIRAGESFADVAKSVSDTKKSQGGDWGWLKRADLKKEFSEPLFALEPGQTTDPVVLPEGVFLIHAEDRRYAGIQPIDEVRETIELILSQTMTREAEERWRERLRRTGYVKLY